MSRLAEALRRLLTTLCLSILTVFFSTSLHAQQLNVRANEIGVLTGPKGPEAGVWVIAETTDLPTKFARIVVAIIAPNDAAAAHYYPAGVLVRDDENPADFGGSTDIPKNITQDNWLRQMNNVDCIGCHQLGQEATRTIPDSLGKFGSSAEAWQRGILSGQSGESMKPTADSPYWGGTVVRDTRANNHNAMFDKQGRIWLAATVRGMDNPLGARRARRTRTPRSFRWRRARGRSRCSIRRQ